MEFIEEITSKVGEEISKRLEDEANKEVSLALKMPLKNEYDEDNHYRPRPLLSNLIEECKIFEEKGIKVSPVDIVNVLFRCKALFAIDTITEYRRRVWAVSLVDENRFAVDRQLKKEGIDKVMTVYLKRLESFQSDRILISEINSYNWDIEQVKVFFINLFKKINCPYTIEEEIDEEWITLFIGYQCFGSYLYCYHHSSAKLRIFLSLLKVAGFLNPWQITYGETWVNVIAPISPVFMGTWSSWGYARGEDLRDARQKIPDWSLRRSFWYRALCRCWLDDRNFDKISSFFIKYSVMRSESLSPWDEQSIKDVAPILDILSSATQLPDLWAKILLIYCCLEHLFVPHGQKNYQKKYIVWGIKAIDSRLLEWFEKLYDLRCDYAHKWYVKNEKALPLIFDSIKNIMDLLNIKLRNKELLEE